MRSKAKLDSEAAEKTVSDIRRPTGGSPLDERFTIWRAR